MTSLAIRLGEHDVGRIELIDGTSRFTLSEAYRKSIQRPTLGQIFFDDESRAHVGKGGRLPNWFSQLLPEGALRAMVEAQAFNKARRHEIHLLEYVGSDLPGAVRILQDDPSARHDEQLDADVVEPPTPVGGVVIAFSLAGLQPKFSVIERADGGLTLPGKDEQGSLILKVPSLGRPRLASAELAAMEWARAAGIDVPAVKIRPTADAPWVPAEMSRASPEALAVSRFDRTPEGSRIHIEDLTQVLDRPPGEYEKYQGITYERLVAVIHGVVSADVDALADARAFVRRLVFMAFSGNEDMHLKNVSLIYADTRQARLAPAYDLVPTRLFVKSDGFALKLGGSNQWRDLRRSSFDSVAEALGRQPREVLEWVDEAAACIRTAWANMRNDLPLTKSERGEIESWWTQVPLLRSA